MKTKMLLVAVPIFIFATLLACAQEKGKQKVKPFLHIPEDVSPEFQAYLRTLTDPALKPRFPDPGDLESWKKVQAAAEKGELAISEPVVQRYAPTVTELTLGGVPVLDVRPKGWTQTKSLSE